MGTTLRLALRSCSGGTIGVLRRSQKVEDRRADMVMEEK